MITINRSVLLNDLFDFSQTGNGLIVGKPGVGKSYILKQLKDHYLEKNILAVMVKIDNLYDPSDKSIQEELGLDSNWIETFKRVKISEDKKALLIFDAFDAARNENFRNEILKQIKKAKEELSSKWNVLVSVRTYDASKSQKLIQLFPLSEDYTDNINCRKRLIPALEDKEVINTISTNKALLQFYSEGNTALKIVLRIPFFLTLSEKILSASSEKEIQELKKLKSETQLLKSYWNKIIVDSNDHIVKEKTLFNLTKILVETKSLNCSKGDFFKGFDSKESESFEYLRSENIVDEVSVGSSRIAFSHNILFDYSVSTLYIKPDIDSVLNFIKEDASRPFFLRPSFVYFFTQLWYDQRELFWGFFWKFSNEKRKELQLFVRLILTGVISSEYDSLSELKPIMEHLEKEERAAIIRNFLQSIRFLRKRTIQQDVEVLEYLSSNLDTLFIWDFAFLLDRAINATDRDVKHQDNFGKSARNFLSYVLEKRKTELKFIIDRLGASRGVELVAKTYETDIEASKKLLQSLFELLKEPDFEIYYFSNLSEYIKDILPHDPAFVGEVYTTLFGHTETSDAQTTMGTGVIMNFLSNRRQDFELCHFRLTEFYPTFLTQFPEHAIPVGLKVVNDYMIEDRGRFAYEPLKEHFHFKEIDCTFIHDLSYIWSDNINFHKPASIADKIVIYFEKLLEDSKLDSLRKFLDVYIEVAQVGYAWKTLLKFSSQAVNKLSDYFFDFCIQEIFLTTSDTSYEIGQLIEAGSNYFDADQIKQIEEKIFEVANKSEKTNTDYFIKKLVSRIPIDKLQLAESKKVIENSGPVANEKPYQSFSSVETFTTEMWLEEKGVDTKDSTNAEFLKKAGELRSFNEKWMNSTPPREEYEAFFHNGQALFYKLKDVISELNTHVVFTVLSDISQVFTIISRSISTLNDNEFKVLKEIILYCFGYISEYDKEVDENASPSRGYSPTPRINASEGLSQIASKEDSEENIKLLTAAVNDPNAVIRFHSIKYINLLSKKQPKHFEEIVYSRLEKENDAFVASIILQNVPSSPYDEKTANKLLELCYKKEALFKSNNSFLDNFTLRTIWLYTTHKNLLADKILNEAYLREEFARTVVFKAFEDFRLLSLKPYTNSEFIIDSTIKWTLNYATKVGEILKGIKKEDFNRDNPVVKDSLNLIDLIIQRIYFVFETRHYGNRPFIQISEENRRYLYLKVKPIFEKIILTSSEIQGTGLIVGHTAHYFIQTLNSVLLYDAKQILSMITEITKLSLQTGYTFDSMAIREVVNLTEKLLADYRQLLTEEDSFSNLIDLLDIYMNSGWVEALELLWKLDEIFK